MASGRNVFLTRALEKILSEKEIKRSQHTKLRVSCERTLSKLWLWFVQLQVFVLPTCPVLSNC